MGNYYALDPRAVIAEYEEGGRMITILLLTMRILGLTLMFGAVLASHSIEPEPRSIREWLCAFIVTSLGVLLFVVGTATVSGSVQ